MLGVGLRAGSNPASFLVSAWTAATQLQGRQLYPAGSLPERENR